MEMQLNALQLNNEPHSDHGIEVLYRFTAFDPFERSTYFGRSLDLGQFERFRRIFHTPFYAVLLNHTQREVLSSLQIGEHNWRCRVLVKGYRGKEEGTFQFDMVQRLGGRWDGYWYTESLTAEGIEKVTLTCI